MRRSQITPRVMFATALLLSSVFGCGRSQSAKPANSTVPAALPSQAGPTIVPIAEGVWYCLDDGEERNRESPDTFPIPSREVREQLQPGQIVKLLFAITVDKNEQVERMWVIVKQRDGGKYVGELNSQPISTQMIQPGMPVRFEPRHVIAIQSKRAENK